MTAAMTTLAAHLPAGSRVGAIGYSFGAAMAARATRPGAPDAPLGLIAPPLGMYDFDFLQGAPPRGARDACCWWPAPRIPTVRSRRSTGWPRSPRPEERIIEGADHFFFGKLYPLGEAIGAWLAGLPPAP